MLEFRAVLRRYHAAAIVDAALYQRIAGVVFLLCLNVYNKSYLVVALPRPRHKLDVVIHRALVKRAVLIRAPADSAGQVGTHRRAAYLRLALDVLLGYLIYIAVLIFLDAVAHYVR